MIHSAGDIFVGGTLNVFGSVTADDNISTNLLSSSTSLPETGSMSDWAGSGALLCRAGYLPMCFIR